MSSLDRILSDKDPDFRKTLCDRQLKNFKKNTRGHIVDLSEDPEMDNEWWALAQHYGLKTPLLDWTESPFVAAYFAVESHEEPEEGRAVWALHRGSALEAGVEIVSPNYRRASRLTAQAGLFTRCSELGESVDEMVQARYEAEDQQNILIKLVLPNREGKKKAESTRLTALRTLNRMNINHQTLFPEIYGAAKCCNKQLEDHYY